MKFIASMLPTAHAQFGSGSTSWSISDFNFLNIFKGTSGSSFDSLLGQIVGIVLEIAAIVAFIYLLMAGFQYITAGGDADKAQKARTGIINALIGIIIIIVSYTLLHYVGTLLTGS